MTLRDRTLAILAENPDIQEAFDTTSSGDRSVLGAALDHENSAMTTTQGSPNDLLWSHLRRHGWMEDAPIPDELGALMPYSIHCRLTELGRRALPVALPILFATSGAQ